MRQEKGKGTVKWIVIICAIALIVFFIVQHITGIVKKEKVKELQADLLLVQAKVEIVKGKNNVNKDENPLKGLPISKIVEKFKIKDLLEKKGISADDIAKYYVLRDSDLSQMDLQELIGKNSGGYIVNYDSFEVIYSKGYENINGLRCYKVSELNKKPELPKNIVVSKTEEKKEENASAETAKTETTSAEPAKTENNNTENANAEPAKTENSTVENTNAEPASNENANQETENNENANREAMKERLLNDMKKFVRHKNEQNVNQEENNNAGEQQENNNAEGQQENNGEQNQNENNGEQNQQAEPAENNEAQNENKEGENQENQNGGNPEANPENNNNENSGENNAENATEPVDEAKVQEAKEKYNVLVNRTKSIFNR